MLEKLRDNPKAVVAALVSAGVIMLAVGNTGSKDNFVDTAKTAEITTSEQDQAVETVEEPVEVEGVQIGSEPEAGAVVVNRDEDNKLSATLRSGDSQTVVVRQMVNEYLSDNDESLSAEQRLYIETNVVDTLSRNDLVFIGDTISVDAAVITEYVNSSADLTESQIKAWGRYL